MQSCHLDFPAYSTSLEHSKRRSARQVQRHRIRVWSSNAAKVESSLWAVLHLLAHTGLHAAEPI